MNIEQRFLTHLKKTETCWFWTARVNTSGYGTFSAGRRSVLAHRFAYEMWVDEVPDGLFLDHTCTNRNCANPAHLRVVTKKQNAEHRTGAQVNNKLGVRGVMRDESSGKYIAQMKHNQKNIYLGRFDTLEEAEKVAKEARANSFTHDDYGTTKEATK